MKYDRSCVLLGGTQEEKKMNRNRNRKEAQV